MATIELLRHGREMGSRLAEDLASAERLCVAVASAEESGLSALPLLPFVERGGELLLLAGASGFTTETALFRRFSGYTGARCRMYFAEPSASFLPRLWVLDKGARRVVYVGSSDLGAGGLGLDIAVNVRIEGNASEPELERPMRLFEELFWSELALPATEVFLDEYEALCAARRVAVAKNPDPARREAFARAIAFRIGELRGKTAARRHLLVVTPKNYAICMTTRSFGRKRQAELERYGKGDPFFFHVTGRGGGLRAMGMFVGEPYRTDAASLRAMDGGALPFRRKFVVLGELRKEIKTRPILEGRRPGAPKHWFNGFVQDSHTLSTDDFDVLHAAFSRALGEEQRQTLPRD